jgi:ATP-dependent RNA helicase DDX56/DBP9
LKWKAPTLIQAHAIREAKTGKDILARARTGSGKTGAYALAALNSILVDKATEGDGAAAQIRALVLVPTKELSKQAARNINELAQCCAGEVSVVDLSSGDALKEYRSVLAERPDIVVGTPTRVLAHIEAGHMDLSESLKTLIIDEADLVFSYGYGDDLVKLLAKLPKIHQTLLMSATLGSDVEALKKLVLRKPVVLKLESSDLPSEKQLSQYTVSCHHDDKFLITYAMLKLRLLRGKTLIFINDVDQCYRLKLFLDHFSITCAVLNSQLPIQSRQHIVEQFNKGVFDYVIASDEAVKGTLKREPRKRGNKGGKPTDTRKRKRTDDEYGVSRGVDFQGIKNVLNFDFPQTPQSYIHRVGR